MKARALALLLLGMGLLAGVAALAPWRILPVAPPEPEVRVGRLDDWPEIKDGVPELVRKAAPRASAADQAPPPAPGVSPALPPPPKAVQAPEPVLAAPAAPAPPPFPPASLPVARPELVLPAPAAPAPLAPELRLRDEAAPPPAPERLAAASPPEPLRPPIAERLPDSEAEGTAPALAPLPPRRPELGDAAERGKPRIPRPPQRSAERREPVPEPTVAAEPPAPPPRERPSVLGVPLPDIGAGARRVRDCVLEFRC